MHNMIWGILCLLRVLLMSQPGDVFEADIIFDRQEGDTWTVYGADLDQLITAPLLTLVGDYACPVVSPDARYLAYNGVVPVGDHVWQYTVYIYTFATQTTQTVGPFTSYRSTACYLQWSPNSEWLVFDSGHLGDDGAFDSYIVRADGTDMRRLTQRWGAGFFAWAADSQSLYLRVSWSVLQLDLETMERELVLDPIQGMGTVRFSPDQTSVYVFGYPPSNPVSLVNLSTGESQTLFEEADIMSLAWSPDGSIGALSVGNNVYAMQDGELWQIVYEAPEQLDVSGWLPDNRTLIMVYGDTDPWLVTIEVEPGIFDELNFLRHGIVPKLTPDGEWIVFLRKHPDGYEIYRMHPDGSNIAPIPNTVFQFGLWQKGPSVLPVPLEVTTNR